MMAYECDPDANSANLFTRSYELIDLITMYCSIVLYLVSTDGVPYTISRVNVQIARAGGRRRRSHDVE